MKSVETLQRLLIQSGAELPKYGIDGDLGNETKSAIDSISYFPDYLKTALKEVGTKEIRGAKHNSRVLEYHSTTGKYSTDEVPWCGSFIAWCMKQHNLPTVKIAERALSWLKFGVKSPEPIIGSIAVKTRRGGGHVCFVVGKNEDGDLYCLGGNQNDEVNISLYKKDVFSDFRILPELDKICRIYNLDSSSTVRES